MKALEMKGITKTFGSVVANRGVDFSVEKGEIHALLGENGAGKTTLMNILFGLYQADEGEIFLDGRKSVFSSPSDAIKGGIGMVHQHFMLVRNMSVLENIVLGLRCPGHPFFKRKKLREDVLAVSSRFSLSVDPDALISDLSVGEQQRVEILKTLYRDARLLVLDEPTAVLTPQEVKELFKVLEALKKDGRSIILISHHLSEIMEVADRVTVLRDGAKVAEKGRGEFDENLLSRLMIGRELTVSSPDHGRKEDSPVILKVSSAGEEELNVRKGEILGIAGVDGNGQVELAEKICGIRKTGKGSVVFRGEDISSMGVSKRFSRGIAYIPDDRNRDALVTDATFLENLMLRSYSRLPFSKNGIFDNKESVKAGDSAVEDFSIKTSGLDARVAELSGGNQQKLVLARELYGSPELLVAMQPTRGLDVGAGEYVHSALFSCRERGGSVLLISTDLEEIVKLSDRIAVMYEGRVMGIVDNDDSLDILEIGLMMGGKKKKEKV